jgi:hypothetical protein
MALKPSMSIRCLRTDYDIGTIYAYPGTGYALFDDEIVSTNTALDIRNFWLQHLLNPDWGTFYAFFMSLPHYHRPSASFANGPMDRTPDIPLPGWDTNFGSSLILFPIKVFDREC